MNEEQNENSERFISGIYNYCDRWCERCPFTSKCFTFAMEKEMHIEKDGGNMDLDGFWEMFENLLNDTIELLYEKAEEFGIDLEDEEFRDFDEDLFAEQQIKRLIIENTDCATSSNEYVKMVDEWFEHIKYKADGIELLGKNSAKKKLAFNLIDSVDVIRWYQYQIHVKIMRALSARGKEEFEDFPKDSDGSAKVALIGIDRSISAWGNLLLNYPGEDRTIFKILYHLVDLQHAVEAKFPQARSFIRPGFDE